MATPSMRLLLLAEGDPETWDSWSGSSRSLLEALRARGHEVTGKDVSAPACVRWLGRAVSWAPSRRRWVARYHLGPVGFWGRSVRARRQIRPYDSRLDAVLQIGATFRGAAAMGVPCFVYCDANVRTASQNGPHGPAAALPPREVVSLERRERAVYAAAAGIFTMSEYLRRSFVHDFDLPAERVVTVYAGANLDPATVIPRAGPPSGPPTVLFVGRQWNRKGGPVLLEAFRGLRLAVPDARLCVVGCRPPVREPGVEIVGPINKESPEGAKQLSSLYRDADLLCLPSRFEPFGIVLVEAMLHGLPCIGTDRCAIPEIIAAGETGWLTPDGNVVALRDRLNTALADRAALAEMGRRGRQRALRLFRWEHVAERMCRHLEQVLSERSGRAHVVARTPVAPR
jgi:glycosyltransferase involved in cell wall biosynthesis